MLAWCHTSHRGQKFNCKNQIVTSKYKCVGHILAFFPNECLEHSKTKLNKLQICLLPQNNSTFHIFQQPLWKASFLFDSNNSMSPSTTHHTTTLINPSSIFLQWTMLPPIPSTWPCLTTTRFLLVGFRMSTLSHFTSYSSKGNS